jgi:hypothetical protein
LPPNERSIKFPKVIFVILVVLSLIIVAASATSVTIASTVVEAKYGLLTYIFYLDSDSVETTTPNVNTEMTPPTTTGDQAIVAGDSAYLWSTEFASSTTISAGAWLVDLWALSLLEGSFTVTAYVTNSAGTVQSTVASGVATTTLSDTEASASAEFLGAQVTVPAGGYIEVELTAPTLGVILLYWGTAQLTDFQIPRVVLT